MSNTAKETTQPEEHFWETISWADVELRVLRYQTRIYKAAKDQNKRKILTFIKSNVSNF